MDNIKRKAVFNRQQEMTKENEIKVGDKYTLEYFLKPIFEKADLPIDVIVISVLMGANESIIEIQDLTNVKYTQLFYIDKFKSFFNKIEE